MYRSLNVPGSDSSALQIKYTGFVFAGAIKPHFTPVGNPAPPRPRNPLAFTSAVIAAGSIPTAFFSISYPPSLR